MPTVLVLFPEEEGDTELDRYGLSASAADSSELGLGVTGRTRGGGRDGVECGMGWVARGWCEAGGTRKRRVVGGLKASFGAEERAELREGWACAEGERR